MSKEAEEPEGKMSDGSLQGSQLWYSEIIGLGKMKTQISFTEADP